MIINGVYGNNNQPVPEPAVNTVPKEETTAGTVKDNVIVDSTPAPVDSGYITYNGEDMQKKTEEKAGEEKNSEENSQADQEKSVSDRITKEDYKEIGEEGISLEKYDKERLTRVLARIKTQRSVREENITEQVDKQQEKHEAIENMAENNSATQRIARKLKETGLPVTEANIARIATAVELASGAVTLTDKATSYLIKNKLEPTIENLYKAQYSGTATKKEAMSQQVFQSLESQVNEIIDKAGLTADEETVNSARWLLNNNLPLTEDSLWAYRDLSRLKENNDESTVLDKAVKAFAAGMNPEAASLGVADAEKAAKAIELFASIGDEAVTEAVKDHEVSKINGKVLEKTQKQQAAAEKATKENQSDSIIDADEVQEEFDIKTVTVRRQLEEIRLKMTLESGQQLIKKGFKLDTDSLSKIVEGLKELEDRYYNSLLKEGKTEASTENIELLKKSLDGVAELKTMPNYILGSTLQNRNKETVNSLMSAGTALKSNLNKAGEAYETLMTKPRPDMGDSIAKAFRNVDDILEDMKLETTQANERAVRILGYNGMEITDQNIQHVKTYDQQVNQLMNHLKPAVAVELIKKGINPLNLPIEELNQQIESIQQELGTTENEKFSKYLWKLEKSNRITEEDKQSYIGIYRLLNTVDKTDGAALGAVLKADREVNLKNLLTAVRTMKNGSVDKTVDDGFGSLTQFSPMGESITEQINTSFTFNESLDQPSVAPEINSDKLGYINQLLKEIKDEMEPEKLKTLGNLEDVLNMSVEKLKEELKLAPEDDMAESIYWDQKLQEYLEINDRSESAQRLLKSYDIPASPANIQAAKDLLSTDQAFYKQLNKLLKDSRTEEAREKESENIDLPVSDLSDISEEFVESFTGPSSVKEQFQVLGNSVDELLNQLTDNPVITSADMATLQRIRYGMSFIQNLAGKESYEIPLMVSGNITNVNVTILRNTGESGKVNIQANSESLGNLSVSLSLKEKGVNALITCDNRNSLEVMRERRTELLGALQNAGIEIEQLNYGIGNTKTDMNRYTNYNTDSKNKKSDPAAAEVSTDTLYSLAKTFLVHIKNAEYETVNV